MPLSSVVGAQSIVRPGVCTSSTRPASPYDGQVIYETDTDKTLVYNGTGWVFLSTSRANPGGLDLVKTQTISSGVSTVQVTNAFSSTYRNYRVIVELTGSTTSANYLRLLVGTTVQTGNILSTEQRFQLSVGSISNGTRSDQYGLFGNVFATYSSFYQVEFNAPFETAYTNWTTNGVSGRSNTDSDQFYISCRNIATTSIDGFELTTASSPTFTGSIRVYGYVNS